MSGFFVSPSKNVENSATLSRWIMIQKRWLKNFLRRTPRQPIPFAANVISLSVWGGNLLPQTVRNWAVHWMKFISIFAYMSGETVKLMTLPFLPILVPMPASILWKPIFPSKAKTQSLLTGLMELMTRFELVTSSLPRMRSTCWATSASSFIGVACFSEALQRHLL